MRWFSLAFLFLILMGHTNALYPYEINFNSEVLGVVFEDKSLTEIEKMIIVEDIRKVLSTTSASAKLKPLPKNDSKEAEESGRIDTGIQGHMWPDKYWKNGFGHYRYSKRKQMRELVVSKNLSDAFREVITFYKKHAKVFDELDIFLAALEKGFEPSRMSLDEKRLLFI